MSGLIAQRWDGVLQSQPGLTQPRIGGNIHLAAYAATVINIRCPYTCLILPQGATVIVADAQSLLSTAEPPSLSNFQRGIAIRKESRTLTRLPRSRVGPTHLWIGRGVRP